MLERFIAFRYLRSPREEGFVSIIAGFSFFGIMLGVATLVIVLSVMNGFREELLNRVTGVRGHIIIQGLGGGIVDYTFLKSEILKIPNVHSVYPVLDRQTVGFFHQSVKGLGVIGITREDLKNRKIFSKALTEKSFSSFTGYGICIGKRMAEQTGLEIGSSLTLLSPEGNNTPFGSLPKRRVFTIVGIFEIGISDFDKNMIMMPLETAQSFFKSNGKIDHFEVFTDNVLLASKIAKNINDKLPKTIKAFDWQHSDAHIFQAVKIERNVMFLILTLIILIASFNILSSLIMLVKDKRKDIAILRTIGATRLSIMKIFCFTGLSIGVLGTGVGLGIGLLFCFNIEKIRNHLESLTGTNLFNAEIYFLSQLPAKVDPYEVILVAALSLSLSFLSTFYPAWKASGVEPAAALRS